jgi:flagella basal body P-ring formation protein FlgA
VTRGVVLAAALLHGLAAAAQGASGQPPPPDTPLPSALPAAALARALALVEQAAAPLAPAKARISALPGGMDPRLKLAPCNRIEPFLPPSVPAWGRTRVGLRCTEGPVAWTVYLPVQVQAWAPALAPHSALPAGHVLTEADLAPVPTDWAARNDAPLGDLPTAVGRTLARAAMPGQPLRQGDLRRKQWFASGDTVKVVASGPGFSVVGEGLALADGLEGQRARVQLLVRDPQGTVSPGRVLNATVRGEREVHVALW